MATLTFSKKKRRKQLGDKCKDCQTIINENNAIYKQDYLQTRCKDCYFVRRDSVPSRTYDARNAQWIQWKYGISIEEYNKKFKQQNNVCAVCKKTGSRRLVIDHDHATGKIRDLLCEKCNTALAMVNDNDILLLDLVRYVLLHRYNIKNKEEIA